MPFASKKAPWAFTNTCWPFPRVIGVIPAVRDVAGVGATLGLTVVTAGVGTATCGEGEGLLCNRALADPTDGVGAAVSAGLGETT